MGLLKSESGQTTVEYGLLYAGVILPLTFAIIFVAEMLWVWHSVVDFTRDGAQYAATHCWESNGQNVITYMHSKGRRRSPCSTSPAIGIPARSSTSPATEIAASIAYRTP